MEIGRRKFLSGALSAGLRPSLKLPCLLQMLPVEQAIAPLRYVAEGEPPHFWFLQSAEFCANSLARLKDAEVTQCPEIIASAVRNCLWWIGTNEPDPAKPPVSTLIKSNAYLQHLQDYAQEIYHGMSITERLGNNTQTASVYLHSLIKRAELSGIDNPNWTTTTIRAIQDTFLKNSHLFNGFDWEKYFRGESDPWEFPFEFADFFKDSAPTDLIENWKSIGKKFDAEYVIREASDAIENYLEDVQPDAYLSYRNLGLDRLHTLIHFNVRLENASDSCKMRQLKKLQTLFSDTFGEETIPMSEIVFDPAGKAESLLLDVSAGHLELFETACLKTRVKAATEGMEGLQVRPNSPATTRPDYYAAMLAAFPPPVASVLHWQNRMPEFR